MSLVLNVEILGEFRKLTQATQGAESNLKGLQDKVGSIASGIGRAVGGLAIALGFTGIVSGLKDAVAAAEEAKVANERIDAIAKSMDLFGVNTDQVSSRIKEFADQQELLVGVDAEVIKATQAKLLTFKEIALTADTMGGAFDRATILAQDLAAAGFGEATANATQLGKALNDPIEGISALSRVGLTFTEDQKRVIESLQNTGDIAGAQAIILAELERQVGGTAAATVTDTKKMEIAFGQVSEQIGTALLPLLEQFTTWLTSPEGQETLDLAVQGITDIIDEFIALVGWINENKDWLVPLVAGITAITAAWKVAIATVGLYRAAVALAGGASAVGTTAAAVGTGAAISTGAVAVPLVTATAVGSYYSTEARQDLQAALDAPENNQPIDWENINWWGRAREPAPVPQNVTINMNAGNITGQQIADAIRRANRSSGTNIIQPRQ
jgi:hypothetical protein